MSRASHPASNRPAPRSEHPRRIVLRDGRLLAFDEHGDPGGEPVLSFHGGISSRLDAVPLAERCEGLGVRLIAPDRPGLGYSDHVRGRTLLDWPEDVRELVDSLGIDRFAVMGWSQGGQYAAACAHAMPGRVTRVALVASVVPFEVVPGRSGLSWIDRGMLALSRWAPPLASLSLRIGISLPSPERLQRAIERDSGAADRRALREDRSPNAMAMAVKASIRSGTRGVIRDYRVFAAPWGFRLDEVRGEVGVWQGDADDMVPVSDAAALAEGIPGAKLAICPGEGHLSLPRNRARQILGWLTEPARRASASVATAE
jgi:pimeloyl-ACP methyl ester carboxylesterase